MSMLEVKVDTGEHYDNTGSGTRDPLPLILILTCQLARLAVAAWVIWMFVVYTNLWSHESELLRVYGDASGLALGPISGFQQLAGYSTTLLTTLVSTVFVVKIWRVFDYYIAGRSFDQQAVAAFRAMAHMAVVMLLVEFVMRFVACAIVTKGAFTFWFLPADPLHCSIVLGILILARILSARPAIVDDPGPIGNGKHYDIAASGTRNFLPVILILTCQLARLAVAAWVIWMFVLYTNLWSHKSELLRIYGDASGLALGPISGFQQLAGYSTTLLTTSVSAVFVVKVWQMFNYSIAGRSFDRQAVAAFRAVAHMAVVMFLVELVMRFIACAIVTKGAFTFWFMPGDPLHCFIVLGILILAEVFWRCHRDDHSQLV